MNIHFHHQSLGILNSHYAIIYGVDIQSHSSQLEALKKEILDKVLVYDEDFIDNLLVNKGYAELLAMFSAEKCTPAGQNFVQMIQKRNKFPTINTAVDAYNIIAAKSFLSIGAHDLDKINGDIVFDFARDGESIPAVNMTDVFEVSEGDYVYRDDDKILAWLDVRDTDLAKLTRETKNIILIVEGNRNATSDYIKDFLTEACELVIKFNGGKYEIKKVME